MYAAPNGVVLSGRHRQARDRTGTGLKACLGIPMGRVGSQAARKWYAYFMAASHQTFLIPTGGIPGMALQLPRLNRRSPDWFYDLCQANGDLQLEQTAEGEIIVMAPAGFESGDRESEALNQLRN